ncbi:ankyrin repeat domain-containing protein 26-like isoform X4 [Pecten maximus]|uniref:ankyrin repeat domain-containing protein 26-like isoform X4 n=1 Tax=Pecten maximus TaxID=6579 RepID=UPI00145845BD|nr:ankyrin repeat domain-containing protein 26-like isoform X4 [Pecten maximus]
MKKFFKKITKNPSKDPAPPGSPRLGAGAQPIPELGYEIRDKDLPKLHKAAWTGDIAKVKQYVKKDCSALDKENRTALHLACVQGHSGVVQELLEWHAKTNVGDNDSKTPLIKAVECNREECVMLLLEHRGDVDAIDRDGDASLHIAVRNGYTNIVKVLLRNGATIDKKNKEGCTPLHISCKGKKPEIIRILLFDSKASVDVSDVNGRTPLMLASYDGSVTAVQLLLQCNANTMIKDTKGFTAEDIAMMTAQHGCCQLIRDHNMKLRRSVSGASSVNTTPRSSMGIPSATPTPRDNTITPEFGLPIQQQSDDESGDEDVSKLSTGGDFDHSWGDDTDMSLSVGDKKGKRLAGQRRPDLPKINLAHAMTKSLPRDNMSDDGGGGDALRSCLKQSSSYAEGGAHGQPSPRTPVSKQDSNKSLHSQTSVEDDWSDDEEVSQNLSRKSNTPRVTWKEGNQLSEMHVITGDEAETTDDDDYKVTAKKRQKLDQGGHSQTQSVEQGYTPTVAVSDKPGIPITPEQHKESEDLRASKAVPEGQGALMQDLGLSDVSETDSDVEFPSEVSDHLLDARVPQLQQVVATPVKQASVEENEEELDSMANSEHLTPRPGILKNWKQHSKELVEQNRSQRSDDVSEWDSDLENELDPEKSISGNEELDTVREPQHIQKGEEEEAQEEAKEEEHFIRDKNTSASHDIDSQIDEADVSDEEDVVEVRRDIALMEAGDSPTHMEYVESSDEGREDYSYQAEPVGSVPEGIDEGTDVELEEELEDMEETSVAMEVTELVKAEKVEERSVVDLVQGSDEDIDDDEMTDLEVARVLAVEELSGSSRMSSSRAESQVKQMLRSASADTLEMLRSDEDEGSNWDSSADVATPRNPVITQTVSNYLPGGDEEDEDDVEEVDFVEEVPLETVNAAIQEAAALDAVSVGTVDSNQSAGTSGSKPETVREVLHRAGLDKDQDDDSEWDSEEEIMSEENPNTRIHEQDHPLPNNATAPRAQLQQDSEEEDETEEISEWEIERQREKAERQRLEEEEERLKEEERKRQLEWEEDERRRREHQRKLAEEEEFEMKLEEEEVEEELRKEEEEAMRIEEEEIAAAEALEREKSVPVREVEHTQIDLHQLKQLRLNQEAEKRQNFFEKLDDVSSDEEFANDHKTSPTLPPTTSIASPKRELKTCNFLSVKNFFKDDKKEALPSPQATSPHITPTNTYQVSSQRTLPKKEETKLVEVVAHEVKEEAIVQSVKSPGLRFSPVPTPTMEMARQKGPEATKPLEIPTHPPPPQFTTVSPPTRSEALPQHKSPTSRPSPTNPTRLKMSLQSDGNSIDEDDSDLEPDRSDMGTYLKNLPTSYSYAPYKGLDLPDDDMLSFTSTENGESSTYATTNIPYGKDVLANMNLSDPNTVIKLQDHLRDQRKMLDHERNQRLTIESKNKSLSKERNEMQKKIDTLNQQRTSLEQAKLDLEQRIRTIEYSLNEEVEMRKNADILLNKTKEQLARKEEQYTSEMEGRQKAELQIRNMQMEIRTATSAVKQLEDEKETLTRQYQHEKNARQLQEQLNDEQQKLQHQLHTEQVKAATQKTDAENRFEVADEDRKYTHDHLEKARAELNAMKMELDRQRSRFKDENALLSSENEELQRKIEDLKTEIKLNEDALAHATVQYNLQISNSRSEVNVLNGVVERERLAREKSDAQLESAKNRLHSAAMELEKSEQARNELERRYQDDKESWEVTKEQKQRELQDLQEQNQTVVRRSHAIESKLTSVENEFHIVSANLMEKSNLYNQSAKDIQYYKSAQESYDQNYQVEKEHNVKLTVKIENLQEKNTGLQHDNLSLKQQLETAQQALADRAADTGQERFTTILASLKTEQDKSRLALEERNSSLTETTSRLREEVRNSEARRTQLEQELNRMNRDYNDLIRKLSVAEASLDMAQKSKDSLEQDRGQLKLEVDRLHQKYEMAHEKSIESQARITEMVDRLERSEQNNLYSSQQILNNSANMEAFSRTKEELEDSFQKIQVDNVKLQAELSHEKQRAEMLQKDLQDSQRVRSSLEELCSNLKSSKAQLEDKLGMESVTRNMMTQEAENNKELWETEVISRSKLGLRIVQYERQRQEAVSQLEEEKRKCRKAMELKKTTEAKYEAEHEKNVQLQTEIASLKSYLKSAKKRLKTVDNSENRINTLHTDFDQERLVMEGTLSTVRRQLSELQQHVEEEVDSKSKLQAKNLQLQNELGSLKRLQKTVEKLERSKSKLEQEHTMYKSRVENGYVEREELEQVRKEIEARYRLELNRKLDEVNSYLEEQARSREKLDTSRDETDSKLKQINKKLQEETTALRIKYEQILAQKESKDMESKRYRDLYESEMQWRMRLSEQLMKSTDRAFNYKTKLVAERQKSRLYNSTGGGNVSFSGILNGQLLDSTRFSGTGDDILGNKLKAELDRSIAKHLEAGPHDNIKPLISNTEDHAVSSSFAKSNSDYLELLKRKYCV